MIVNSRHAYFSFKSVFRHRFHSSVLSFHVAPLIETLWNTPPLRKKKKVWKLYLGLLILSSDRILLLFFQKAVQKTSWFKVGAQHSFSLEADVILPSMLHFAVNQCCHSPVRSECVLTKTSSTLLQRQAKSSFPMRSLKRVFCLDREKLQSSVDLSKDRQYGPILWLVTERAELDQPQDINCFQWHCISFYPWAF